MIFAVLPEFLNNFLKSCGLLQDFLLFWREY